MSNHSRGELMPSLFESSGSFTRYDFWDLILDERGRPRLKPARRELLPLTREEIPLLLEGFEYWQKYDEYMVLRETDLKTGEIEYFGVKCSKRGNDYYNFRLKKRLKFLKYYQESEIFSPNDFQEGFSLKVGPPCLLWVTLTYDSKRTTLDQAWNRFMPEFNKWITRIRQKYGKVWYVSFPQPFPGKGEARGYPHMHLLMLFENASFHVFPHMELNRAGDLQLVYRVQEKEDLHRVGGWHSHIDVKALRSGRHAYNYTMKYSQNAIMGKEEEKSKINNAVLWLYRKKSFNVSGSFRESYLDLIKSHLRNSKSGQVTLEGEFIPETKVEFVGIYNRSEIMRIREVKGPPGWLFKLTRDQVAELDLNRGRAIYQ